MPSYAALLPLRAITMLGAAVFTPQAGAAIGFMSPPEQRGRAIAFIFLGWSLASVLGLPMADWIGETFGWRCAFAAIAVLSLVGRGLGLRRHARRRHARRRSRWPPGRTRVPNPVLMAIVAVTVLFGAGQFTLFAYFTPYFRDVLQAPTDQSSLLLVWFGIFGVIGNLALTRFIDRDRRAMPR